jgi:hypothetical protein
VVDRRERAKRVDENFIAVLCLKRSVADMMGWSN